MAIGVRKGSGTTPPLWKFDTRIGRIYIEDRVFEGGSWQPRQRDVTTGFRAALDLANLFVGFILFVKNAPPETLLVPVGEPLPEPPSDEWKQGLLLHALLSGEKVARELLSTSGAFWGAIDRLHDDYLAERDAHPDAVPIVTLVSVHEERNAGGSISHVPEFEINGWLPRPAALTPAPRPQSKPRPQPEPAPKAKPKAPPRSGMDDEIPF